jgi:hypothetical protein
MILHRPPQDKDDHTKPPTTRSAGPAAAPANAASVVCLSAPCFYMSRWSSPRPAASRIAMCEAAARHRRDDAPMDHLDLPFAIALRGACAVAC